MPREERSVRRAIILAAGLGSRLRPLTHRTPKPLIPVNGVPILHNTLQCLADEGIRETIIVVGYRKESIIRSCGFHFAGMEITYCESPNFARTGSAYSLWLARDFFNEDILLMEGDVFFERAILHRLLADATSDIAAVAPFVEGMTGSAVTLHGNGNVGAIRMNQTAEGAKAEALLKTVNLFKLRRATLQKAVQPFLDGLVASGQITAYLEQALQHLVGEQALTLRIANCWDLKWFEIDNEMDLRAAERIFALPDRSSQQAL